MRNEQNNCIHFIVFALWRFGLGVRSCRNGKLSVFMFFGLFFGDANDSRICYLLERGCGVTWDRYRLTSEMRERLQWEQHPTMTGHLRGFLEDKPNLTLFLIEICEDKPERGRLIGAVIPDDHEKDGGFERSLIWWLQKSVAPQYLADFVAYLSNNEHAKGEAPPPGSAGAKTQKGN